MIEPAFVDVLVTPWRRLGTKDCENAIKNQVAPRLLILGHTVASFWAAPGAVRNPIGASSVHS